MNETQFEELLGSVRDMGKHMRGDAVEGVIVKEFSELNVTAIREKTGLSATSFAHLIGVRPSTLQNWEKQRVRPTGTARALLKIVAANPQTLATLNG
jgi:putative transcriptional regulator